MKKFMLVVFMLITSLIAKPLDGEINNTNETTLNTIEEISVIYEDKVNNETKEKTENENAQAEIKVDETKQEIDTLDIQTEIKPQIKEEPKAEENNLNNTSNSFSTIPKQQEMPQTQLQQEEKTKQDIVKYQEEKIYCVDGGNVHIYGDGANEHGYYKTWDEAFKAYEEYTKGWASTEFKVDQCACGLYYFWVIE